MGQLSYPPAPLERKTNLAGLRIQVVFIYLMRVLAAAHLEGLMKFLLIVTRREPAGGNWIISDTVQPNFNPDLYLHCSALLIVNITWMKLKHHKNCNCCPLSPQHCQVTLKSDERHPQLQQCTTIECFILLQVDHNRV